MRKYRSLETIRQDLYNEALTCRGLVNFYLDKIELHSPLNAFLEVYGQEARDRAEAIDIKITKGTAGPLAGMVIGIKDVISHKDHPAHASSKILKSYQAQFSATAVDRLLEADAIIIGRQNCDEFGMGSANENSAYGPVKNGLDPRYVPGGSSGGSAVAVQMEMCLASLGTDTGGSVRQPASFCGLVGLKPTYSRISRHGLLAYASSFDTIGIISNNIADNASILEVIAGEDKFDSTVSSRPLRSYPIDNNDFTRKKFCYFKNILTNEALSPESRESFLTSLSALKSDGHQVEGVEFPLLEYVLPAYYLLTMAEASSNLARYDGVRYGVRSNDANNLHDLYLNTRSEGFGAEVQRRIMLGTFVLSAGYYDAYYEKAQKIRRKVREQTLELLDSYDYILSPTTPGTAFKIGQRRKNPVEIYLEDLFTVQPSMGGVPAISLPIKPNSGNLPLGLQVVAKDFNENELYSFGEYFLKLMD